MTSRMIVISRNGKTTVITGCGGWLVGALTVAVAWLTFALGAFLLVGFALTAGVMLMLMIPAVIVVALLGRAFRGRG